MITAEEKEEIINLAVERAILSLPEVVGNLLTSQMSLLKINEEFYAKYPEFRDKKGVVAAVIEMVEGKNTLDDYDKILEKAVPEIRKRIGTIKDLDMVNVSRPSRDFDDSGHGEL